MIDFSLHFSGKATWLAIGVRTNFGGGFTTLRPFQPLSPMAFALYSPSAGTASCAIAVATAATNVVRTASSILVTGGSRPNLNLILKVYLYFRHPGCVLSQFVQVAARQLRSEYSLPSDPNL